MNFKNGGNGRPEAEGSKKERAGRSVASWSLGDGNILQGGSGAEEFRPACRGSAVMRLLMELPRFWRPGLSRQPLPGFQHLTSGRGRKTPWELGMVLGNMPGHFQLVLWTLTGNHNGVSEQPVLLAGTSEPRKDGLWAPAAPSSCIAPHPPAPSSDHTCCQGMKPGTQTLYMDTEATSTKENRHHRAEAGPSRKKQ